MTNDVKEFDISDTYSTSDQATLVAEPDQQLGYKKQHVVVRWVKNHPIVAIICTVVSVAALAYGILCLVRLFRLY